MDPDLIHKIHQISGQIQCTPTPNIVSIDCICSNPPELEVICKCGRWLEILDAEDDSDAATECWGATACSPCNNRYLAMAKSDSYSCCRYRLYKLDKSLSLVLCCMPVNPLSNASRRSGLVDDELTGCNWCNGVVCDDDRPAERFAAEWLPVARAEGCASEYEIPPLAPIDGASSDLVFTDSKYLREYSSLDVVLGGSSGNTGRVSGGVDSRWRVDEDNDGKRNKELAPAGADGVVVGWAGRVLAKDGVTTAVERFVVEQLYGGNESRRNSVDDMLWSFARSKLGADDAPHFTGEICKALVTADDGEVNVTCFTCFNRSFSDTGWLLLMIFGETTAAAGGSFRSEEPETSQFHTAKLFVICNKCHSVVLNL